MGVSCETLHEALVDSGADFFTGVPDSITGPYSNYLADKAPDKHVIASNEGNAVGMAIGSHLNGGLPVVYMQNSGLGNAVDPLLSLANDTVLAVPMILLIGWRGQPGTNDEPQHAAQGAMTGQLLATMGIPRDVLGRCAEPVTEQVQNLVEAARQISKPVALLIPKNTLQDYALDTSHDTHLLSREQALHAVLEMVEPEALIVSGIGKLSRELFEYRSARGQGHERDVLVVGGMGHASSVALGAALQQSERRVYCLDGDGATLMHLGALATIGTQRPANLTHVVFNNGAHDSVGGQPTAAMNVDIPSIAHACGYAHAVSVESAQTLQANLHKPGLSMLEIMIRGGARSELGRPTISPAQNKLAVQRFLS